MNSVLYFTYHDANDELRIFIEYGHLHVITKNNIEFKSERITAVDIYNKSTSTGNDDLFDAYLNDQCNVGIKNIAEDYISVQFYEKLGDRVWKCICKKTDFVERQMYEKFTVQQRLKTLENNLDCLARVGMIL